MIIQRKTIHHHSRSRRLQQRGGRRLLSLSQSPTMPCRCCMSISHTFYSHLLQVFKKVFFRWLRIHKLMHQHDWIVCQVDVKGDWGQIWQTSNIPEVIRIENFRKLMSRHVCVWAIQFNTLRERIQRITATEVVGICMKLHRSLSVHPIVHFKTQNCHKKSMRRHIT